MKTTLAMALVVSPLDLVQAIKDELAVILPKYLDRDARAWRTTGPAEDDSDDDAIVHDMSSYVVKKALKRLIVDQITFAIFDDIKKVDIPFGGKPEESCIPGNVRPKKLGQGFFARVYQVSDTVAAKIITMGTSYRRKRPLVQRKKFDAEVAMATRMGKLGVGPEVIDHYACCRGDGKCNGVILMRRVQGTTLAEALEKATAKQKDQIRQKLEKKIEAMHAAGVVHNDLHSGNVMVTPGRDVFLVDFGFARDVHDEKRLRAADADDSEVFQAEWEEFKEMFAEEDGKVGMRRRGSARMIRTIVKKVMERLIAKGTVVVNGKSKTVAKKKGAN